MVDQLIQQALYQMLLPVFEPTFSELSDDFRLGQPAAQAYVGKGRRWVVHLDLEKFFDRVNHNVLMLLASRPAHDARVLKLICRFLEAGMMQDGLVAARTEGIPPGVQLSPLVSNIMPTDLDREV